jgi:DNA-binding response OmpR family regulator
VLLIENDQYVCEALHDILKEYGIRVLIAHDGIEGEALYRAHQHDINVVILDWRLPRQDGRATLHKIRQLNPNVHVMISSGHTADEVLAQLDDQRPISFLGKPFSVDKFMDQVNRLLA